MGKPKNIETCKTCIFWQPDNPLVTKPLSRFYGECHVYPPSTDPKGGHPAVYPVTRENWWCNEFKKDPDK